MELSQRQNSQIALFNQLLLEKNQSINLFSRKNPDSQIEFLLVQGFMTGQALGPVLISHSSDPVLDIGSGNGFPGFLFAILFPKSLFYLCERSRKKSEFLKYVSNKAELKNVKILCQRAEDIENPFQIILSQAALPIEKMLKLLTRILAPKGQAFLWQNPSWKMEWPKTKQFTPEVFKSYKINDSEKILLKLEKV